MLRHALTINDLPLFVEVSKRPNNPGNLPDVFPFHLGIEDSTCSIRQIGTPELTALLGEVYEYGSTVGNAMDDSGAGRNYAEDFLTFVNESIPQASRVLEIGAGRGYLVKRMIESGHRVDALEPGKAQSGFWKKYGVSIIPEMFPSEKAPGPYDAIVFYGVLEHISELDSFLSEVRSHLAEGGRAVLSVPDSSIELENGDPSILLHEHFQYFSQSSLTRVLNANGLRVASMRNSGFGRCIYASVVQDDGVAMSPVDGRERETIEIYPLRVIAARESVGILVDKVQRENRTLGIYCPGRALSLLPMSMTYRFFDDAPEFLGCYYPPYGASIEDRAMLASNPTDELWIMSRTFGDKLKEQIVSLGLSMKVRTMDEILGKSGS